MENKEFQDWSEETFKRFLDLAEAKFLVVRQSFIDIGKKILGTESMDIAKVGNNADDKVMAQLQIIDQKLDKILAAPLKLAVQHYQSSMREASHQRYEEAFESVGKSIDQAMKAIAYCQEGNMSRADIEKCFRAMKVLCLAKVLKYSYDKEEKVFLPYYSLTKETQSLIATELENLVKTCIDIAASAPAGKVYTSEAEKQALQDALDTILACTYPYISCGFGWTKPLSTFDETETDTCTFKVKHSYIPEGESDKVVVDIATKNGVQMMSMALWKTLTYVVARFGNAAPQGTRIDSIYQEMMSVQVSFDPKIAVTLSSIKVTLMNRVK